MFVGDRGSRSGVVYVDRNIENGNGSVGNSEG